MDAVQPVAQGISTYGLYAIISILCIVVAYLHRQGNGIEKEIHTLLDAKAKESAERAAEAARQASEFAKSQAQMFDVLKDNTKAFNDFQAAINELKTTIQFLTERRP